MGAVTFGTYGHGETALEAFGDAVERAYWDHGHGGYTGTIAEKDGFVEYSLPDGVALDDLIGALVFAADVDLGELETIFGRETASRLFAVYDDKWGPAVAVKVSDGEWYFCGWASC